MKGLFSFVKFDFAVPMTFYEFVAIILAAIAIIIPIVQAIWKKWIVRAKLKYYPTGRAYLYCNKSGSYISIEGVFEALRKPITVKKVAVSIERVKDSRKLNLQWSVFNSPVNQSIAGNFASSSEIAHPFRIEADSVMCAFTEFADAYNSAGKKIVPAFDKLSQKLMQIGISIMDYNAAKQAVMDTAEYAEAKLALENEFFWEIGKYNAVITAQYSNKTVVFNHKFCIDKDDYDKLRANLEEVLISGVKSAYRMSFAMQPVSVEFE